MVATEREGEFDSSVLSCEYFCDACSKKKETQCGQGQDLKWQCSIFCENFGLVEESAFSRGERGTHVTQSNEPSPGGSRAASKEINCMGGRSRAEADVS